MLFDARTAVVHGAEALAGLTRETESPWLEVRLLDSLFAPGHAALCYEGIDKRSGVPHRVNELLSVQDGRIVRILATISALEPTQ